MRLRVYTPEGVAVDETVVKVIADSACGLFCLEPRHVDFATALVPGILTYMDDLEREHFAAVDRAILVKRGAVVEVSATRAVGGGNLAELERTVRDVYEELGESEQKVRSALARLEAAFQRRILQAGETLWA